PTMTHTTMRAIALGAGLTIFGCNAREIELRETSRDIGSPSMLPGDEPAEEAQVPVPTVDDDGETGEAPIVDTPVVPAGRPSDGSEAPPAVVGLERGCKKIDFLFVIDNSDSMDDEQANLARSFPGFINV